MLGYALFVCALSRFPADAGAAAGGVRESLGPRLLARQSHAAAISTICCSSRRRRSRRHHQHLRLFRHHGIRRDRPVARHRLCGERASWCRGATCWPSSAWRRSSFPASCWRSASMPPTRRRRSRSTAPRTILVLAFTTRFLPIAYTSSAAGMRSINPEMEEAVRILGGGRLLAIRKVLAPLLKRKSRRRLDPGVHPGDARAVRRRSSWSGRTRA